MNIHSRCPLAKFKTKCQAQLGKIRIKSLALDQVRIVVTAAKKGFALLAKFGLDMFILCF